MGMFNPRLPMSRSELYNYGITGDLSEYASPFITQEILLHMFGNDLEQVFEIFFSISANGKIVFKSSFDTQFKISVFIAQNPGFSKYEKNLLHLITEVLLLEEPGSNGEYFNPRITLATTNVYNHLDDTSKARFTAVYNDYYFSRHDEYWKQQAMWKLPAILDASDMLICGEDLGMIPKAVPGVMRAMNIISLEIQRMPKGNTKFGNVSGYPYFSVCSPSCHDMSTIRGYWESNHDTAKDFYYNYLHWYGLTPIECTPEIVQAIVEDHLMSPSMLAIFPIQDLVGMDTALRKKDVLSEQINEPSNPKHYWKYRFHINIEDLNNATDLNKKIKYLVLKSGR
jgi:4-alpha-glucanotransferase